MFDARSFPEAMPPHPPLSAVIDHYGPWRVLGAALVALARPRPSRAGRHADRLGNHIRRDIGLPPITSPPAHWPYP